VALLTEHPRATEPCGSAQDLQLGSRATTSWRHMSRFHDTELEVSINVDLGKQEYLISHYSSRKEKDSKKSPMQMSPSPVTLPR
jgi:hypothetical protein